MIETPRVAMITGARGFVGMHLVNDLERETAWDIIGLAREYGQLGLRTRVLACDLNDRDLVRRVIARHIPDVIIHLAAQTYVPRSFADPAETILNNIAGELNLLEAVLKSGRRPIILVVGSSEVYGSVQRDELPIREDAPFRPANPYAVSKIAQDMLAFQYSFSHGLPIVRFRPFNHIGPGQSERFVVSGFARQIAQAELGQVEPVVLVGNLDAARDFLDVRDVVRAYRLAIDSANPGEVYNLASGIARPIADLLSLLIDMATIDITVRHDPARLRPSETPVVRGDATRFRNATGWEPRISIEQSLRDTLDDWRIRLRSISEAADL